jgi:hypothetical protein
MRAIAALLLLLASVGTASAECAWVLWAKLEDRIGADWRIVDAFTSLSGRSSMAESACERGGREIVGDTNRYLCLPDTIDPRGPRAK